MYVLNQVCDQQMGCERSVPGCKLDMFSPDCRRKSVKEILSDSSEIRAHEQHHPAEVELPVAKNVKVIMEHVKSLFFFILWVSNIVWIFCFQTLYGYFVFRYQECARS